MQYTLTKEEYDALGPKSETEKWKANAQALATLVAENIPRKHEDGTDLWTGCILTSNCGYCDMCPAKDKCPHPHKEYSK